MRDENRDGADPAPAEEDASGASSWTDERVDKLMELWAEGKSAHQIAVELGGGLSRSAIIGKVHRLQLAHPYRRDSLRESAREVVESVGLGLVGRKATPRKVVRPPGSLAVRVLAFLFSKRTFENVFLPAIADMRHEHAEALSEASFGKARWIVCRDHIGLVLTIFAYLAASVGKKLSYIWKIIS